MSPSMTPTQFQSMSKQEAPVPAASVMSAYTADPEGASVDFRELLRICMKHWRLMAAITGAALGTGILYVLFATPVWQATVTLELPKQNGGANIFSQLASLDSTTDPVITCEQVATSFNVAQRAARAVELNRAAQFKECKSPEDAAEQMLKEHLVAVSNVKMSDILQFNVNLHDKALAVRLANAWAQAFIDANLDFERIGAASRRRFLDAQLTALKAVMTQEEQALMRLAQRQAVLHAGGANGSDAVFNPIVKLQTQVQDLLIQKSEDATTYTADYPAVKALDARYREALAELRRQLNKLPVDDFNYARLDREVKADAKIYNLLLEKDQEARMEENVDDSGIVVVDQARMPERPVAPKKTAVLVGGLMTGLLLSVLFAWALEMWRDEVGGESDIAKVSGLPILAMISDWRIELKDNSSSKKQVEKKSGPVEAVRHDPASLIIRPELKYTYYSESFRVLRTNLAFSGIDHRIQTFGVLSPNAREGKTLLNSNLALALASTGKKVLLVDADLRKPSVHKIFNLPVTKDQGLPVLMRDQKYDMAKHIFRGPVDGLELLPCGVMVPNPSEIIGSEAFVRVLTMLKGQYDYIVFDTTPVLPVTDGVLLASRLDGVALAARFEQTRKVEIIKALQYLFVGHAPILGMILNAVDLNKYTYTYGYNRYYAYHEKGREGDF